MGNIPAVGSEAQEAAADRSSSSLGTMLTNVGRVSLVSAAVTGGSGAATTSLVAAYSGWVPALVISLVTILPSTLIAAMIVVLAFVERSRAEANRHAERSRDQELGGHLIAKMTESRSDLTRALWIMRPGHGPDGERRAADRREPAGPVEEDRP